MKYTKFAAASIALAVGLILSGCGGAASNAANSNSKSPSTNSSPAANASPVTNASPAASTAPVAKQGTPPKADFTMAADALHKEYDEMLKKDPASIAAKFQDKNIQFTGTIKSMDTVQLGTGSGMDHVYTISGDGKEDDVSCTFNPETEESAKLAVGQKVTLQGTQTRNQNMPPRLEKCFVIKGAQ